MPCFHPWEPPRSMGLPPRVKLLPCGHCIGCRLERSRQQAARCIHESKSHHYNTWVTLTYDHEHLPQRYNTGLIHPKTKQPIYSGSLNKLDFPRFIRSIRKRLPVEGSPATRHIAHERVLRYYYAGEYGDQYRRPHYHACLFGIEFLDKKLIQATEAGFKLYESKTLTELWPHGNHMIGDLTFETAAYTARYIMKKINGKQAEKHYQAIDTTTGEIIQLTPEFNEASRRPGLGRTHYEKYKTDFYKRDNSSINVRGHHSRPPRYYDKLYEKENPFHYQHIKIERQLEAITKAKNRTAERLQAEEIITESKLQMLRGKL